MQAFLQRGYGIALPGRAERLCNQRELLVQRSLGRVAASEGIAPGGQNLLHSQYFSYAILPQCSQVLGGLRRIAGAGSA
jgi:hypothetical protein